jgi:hypothetical protein
LCRLVAASQQNHELAPELSDVHAVPRTKIDLELDNAFANFARLSRVASAKASNSSVNARLCGPIT